MKLNPRRLNWAAARRQLHRVLQVPLIPPCLDRWRREPTHLAGSWPGLSPATSFCVPRAHIRGRPDKAGDDGDMQVETITAVELISLYGIKLHSHCRVKVNDGEG